MSNLHRRAPVGSERWARKPWGRFEHKNGAGSHAEADDVRGNPQALRGIYGRTLSCSHLETAQELNIPTASFGRKMQPVVLFKIMSGVIAFLPKTKNPPLWWRFLTYSVSTRPQSQMTLSLPMHTRRRQKLGPRKRHVEKARQQRGFVPLPLVDGTEEPNSSVPSTIHAALLGVFERRVLQHGRNRTSARMEMAAGNPIPSRGAADAGLNQMGPAPINSRTTGRTHPIVGSDNTSPGKTCVDIEADCKSTQVG